MSKPVILKAIGANGSFSLTCETIVQMEETRYAMAYKGFLPTSKYNKATDTAVEYVLVYSIFRKFPPIFFN